MRSRWNDKRYGAWRLLCPIFLWQTENGSDIIRKMGDKVVVCPDGCVLFRIAAKPLGNQDLLRINF